MIIYCLRHGETSSNVSGIVTGRSDESLNQNGIAQAQKLNQELSNKHFDAVFVSPMRRAIETAEIIVPEYEYIIDERLAERDLSTLQNYTIDELWRLPDWNSTTALRTQAGAETFGSGLQRVRSFIVDLKQRFPNDTPTEPEVLVIAHSFISRCFWAITNNITAEKDFSKFRHRNAEIKIYRLSSHLPKN